MKIRIFLTTLIILSLSISLKSQSNNDSIFHLEKSIGRTHIIPLGLTIEQHITNQTTILVDMGATFLYQSTKINDNVDREFKIIPYLALEPRIYTNLKAREEKGKRVDYHSGSYGAFRFQGGFDMESNYWNLHFGPLIGFQRTFGKKGYFDIGIGCGGALVEDEFRFGLIGNLSLGHIVN